MKFEFATHDRVMAVHHFDSNGQYTQTKECVIYANTGLPAKSTLTPLPELNASERAYFVDGEWVKTVYYIGRTYYDQYANKCVIDVYPFEVSAAISFEKPLQKKEGFYVELVAGEWVYQVDNIGRIAYSKQGQGQGQDDYFIESNEPLPNTHTTVERAPFSIWDESSNTWLYQQELERPFKERQEREWRNAQLDSVLARLDQYEKDKAYPVELRTSPLTEEQYMTLLQDRKRLSTYPQSNGFPFGERPEFQGAQFVIN
ncbi:hypothetical protein [Vibrio ichthyoenteri]|uniref:hypothetical protein n=1 Tax=Vibrio ichthyoenteri TaxID=142461 RepID=UPI0002E91138|nr:hypothetical protein [Vibrio ichthyoenteri]